MQQNKRRLFGSMKPNVSKVFNKLQPNMIERVFLKFCKEMCEWVWIQLVGLVVQMGRPKKTTIIVGLWASKSPFGSVFF